VSIIPPSLIGILIVLSIVIFGLAMYFSLIRFMKMKKRQKQIGAELVLQKEKLLRLDKKVDKKRAALEAFSKKIKEAGKKLGRISEVKGLRTALKEEHKKNHELETEIKRLNHNIKARRVMQPAAKTTQPGNNGDAEKIKEKYPVLPKNQLERIEIERTIARSLMKNNGGSFFISQILRKLEGLYQRHIKPNDRLMLLNEIKSWVERDPLCKGVKSTDKIQHYTFI